MNNIPLVRTTLLISTSERDRLRRTVPRGLQSSFIRASINAMLDLVEDNDDHRHNVLAQILENKLRIGVSE